jgi:hypothetical protein
MLVRKKVLSHAILILLLISALPLIVQSSSKDVSAAVNHWWIGGGSDSLASNPDNWDYGDGVPLSNDHVAFPDGNKSCTWDLSITVADFFVWPNYSATITIQSDLILSWSGSPQASIGAKAIINITSGHFFTYVTSFASKFENYGTFIGLGTLIISAYDADETIHFGTINCPLQISADYFSTADRSIVIQADTQFGSGLNVFSGSPYYTITVDAHVCHLKANGTTTIGIRGFIIYATFTITSSPGWGGGVQTGHSYTYEVNLSTTASPGEIYTLTTNATWLHWDLADASIYGTPDSVFGGHWYYVNISVADGMLSTYQNYTVLVVSIETAQDYVPVLMGLVFGFGLIAMSVVDKRHSIWPTFTGLAWIVISVVVFYPVGITWMILGIGIGLVMWVEGAMEYAAGRQGT